MELAVLAALVECGACEPVWSGGACGAFGLGGACDANGACESVELAELALPAEFVENLELARGACEACCINTLCLNIPSMCLARGSDGACGACGLGGMRSL